MKSRLLGAAVAVLLVIGALALRAQSITPVLSYSVSGTTVTLTWTAASGATSYELVVAGFASPIGVGSGLSYTAAVPPGFYSVQVRGRAGTVVGPLSAAVLVPVAVSTPAPTNLSGILGATSVLLTWDLPSLVGVTGMAVQLMNGATVAAQAPIPVGTYASVPNVPAGTYTVRVIGSGPAGLSAPSNTVTITFPGCIVAAPIPVAVDTSSGVSIQWPPVPGATGYRLDVSSTPGGQLIASLPLGAAQTSLVTTAPMGTYYITLHAALSCGLTARSAEQGLSVTRPSPVNWSKEEWRVWFFNLVNSRGLTNATLAAMQATRNDLVAMGADWQNGWRGDMRPRIYLPVPNCPPPSTSTAPACSYTRAVDVGEGGVGGPWTWVPRF